MRSSPVTPRGFVISAGQLTQIALYQGWLMLESGSAAKVGLFDNILGIIRVLQNSERDSVHPIAPEVVQGSQRGLVRISHAPMRDNPGRQAHTRRPNRYSRGSESIVRHVYAGVLKTD
jgi:hypothetical protein